MVAAMFLSLPFSHTSEINFLDAFFTAISAITCTGLIIKDTAVDFTHIGHGILLFLIQLGGFGYMTMLGLIYVVFRKRLDVAEKNMLKETLGSNHENMKDFIKQIFIYVVIIESVGAGLLSLDFSVRFGIKDGIWYGIFHAITAFNNGGFSIFPNNLIDFRDDILVNVTICALSLLGSIGYICLAELHLFFKKRLERQTHSFSLHFKVVIYVNILLITLGALIVLILEWSNKETFHSFDFFGKIMTSIFTSINYRSAGFITYDISNLNSSTLFFSIFFMLIGGAPGGTAAGFKVTTLAVLFAFSRAILNNSEPRLFNRSIEKESVNKAFLVFIISSFYFFFLSLFLAIVEPSINFFALAYEVNAAFSNVGISTGNGGILSLCTNFNSAGKILIIIAMVLGKIGVVIFTLALFGNSKVSRINYVKEKIIL